MKKIGIAFADFISTEKPSRFRRKLDLDESRRFQSYPGFRGIVLLLFFVGCLSILFLRTAFLQVVQGAYYKVLSDSNRTRTIIIHAPRGIIFDRNGQPLVYNVAGFRQTIDKKPVFLDENQALELIAKGEKNLEIDSLRKYPYADSLAHVLGYVGPITEEEIDDPKFVDYNLTDVIGRMGVERQYESLLRGKDGRQLIEIDATGKEVRMLGKTDPLPGTDITLTIDAKLQEAAYAALSDVEKGVVIATTPDGEVLTLVSKPSFDTNLFTLGKHYKPASHSAYQTVSAVLTDGENEPLLNRAIAGVYPPGSTFKLITAAAALENKIVDKNFQVEDTGILKIGEFSFANWYFTNNGKTDGLVNVVKAIARSNDIYFYKVADMIGVEKLSAMARKFGLGEKVGIDLAGEAKGLVPSPKWKEEVIGDRWYLGDNYHYGIGQGFLLTTPLQVNTWTQALAAGGILYEPHLLKTQEPQMKSKGIVSQQTTDIIREGMIGSCHPDTGVAWPLYEFRIKNSELRINNKDILAVQPSSESAALKDIQDYRQIVVACKTGTAQHGDEETLPHSWITLFAPAYDPEIVVTVLAESSGEGSNIAGPVAKKVLEEWFSRK